MKVYVVAAFNEEAQCVCQRRADAEEMVLSLMEDYYYNQFYATLQYTFTWSAEKCLEYAKNLWKTDENYWIEEVEFVYETLG